MSMKAVAIRTINLGGIFFNSRPRTNSRAAPIRKRTTRTIGDASACAAPPWMITSGGWLAERGGRHGATHDAGECDDREHVRNHLDKLRRNELQALKLDLECFCCSEQYAGERHSRGSPVAENNGSQRDEAATGGHVVSELVLVQRQVDASQRGQGAREEDRCPPDPRRANAKALGGFRLFTNRADAKAEARIGEQPGNCRECNEAEDNERVEQRGQERDWS